MSSFLIFLAFAPIIGPFVYAILILRKLDDAAKKRKQLGGKPGSGFMLVDLMSLIFLLGIPLRILEFEFEFDGGVSISLTLLACGAMLLVWRTTIKTIAQAGIESFQWRFLIAMFLIPTMYVGCFFVGIASINLAHGESIGPDGMAWFVVAVIGMITAPWIAGGAIRSGEGTQLEDDVAKVVDPFAD